MMIREFNVTNYPNAPTMYIIDSNILIAMGQLYYNGKCNIADTTYNTVISSNAITPINMTAPARFMAGIGCGDCGGGRIMSGMYRYYFHCSCKTFCSLTHSDRYRLMSVW